MKNQLLDQPKKYELSELATLGELNLTFWNIYPTVFKGIVCIDCFIILVQYLIV